MSSAPPGPATTPCLGDALHQATGAVSRLYDEELREVGLRTTQYALLARLPKRTWASLMEILPELTRLADTV
jgi:hypothetical protein